MKTGKIQSDLSLQSDESMESRRPAFQHYSHLSYIEDPLIGQANCFLPFMRKTPMLYLRMIQTKGRHISAGGTSSVLVTGTL